ncbi:MAG TPA: hypothetical protein VHE12_01775 [bacterium]|nr:hypothetical protein [bacterium]
MHDHPTGAALGFILLTFLTSTVTFGVVVFGIILRRKILLWNDQWKEQIEASGTTIVDFAEDLERTFEKIRYTFRLLGFFVALVVGLMGYIIYLGLQDKPLLGYPQVQNSLWLLLLVLLSALLPAFINFGVGTYLTETMLLKANAFAFQEAREDYREKKVKRQMMDKAKELKAKREAARVAAAAPPAEANPAGK